MLKIAHIINPFAATAKHEEIQKITFDSIFNAMKYAEKDVEIDLVSVQFEEDLKKTKDLIDIYLTEHLDQSE